MSDNPFNIKVPKKEITDELWRRGELSWMMHDIQKEMYALYESAEPRSTQVWLLSRQSGKCIISSTLVSTPLGAVMIKDLTEGDIVYGYNALGNVEKTEVKQIHIQGVKTVMDLKHRGRIIATATPDHKWLAWDTYKKEPCIKETRELVKNSARFKIKREYFNTSGGDIHEPHAYSIGAMIGDGYCNAKNVINYSVSSRDNKIPSAIAKELGCEFYKNGGDNFNWTLSSSIKNTKGYSIPVPFHYYDEWCKNRLSHTKTCDYEVIRTWTRESQIRFLAGLIDTDGSICVVGRKKNELKFSISMQAEIVIDTIRKLFLDLWQIELCYSIDDRTKYKKGACHTAYTNNNFNVKRFLKEMTNHLVSEQKQYKPEYDNFSEYNHISEYVGVVAGDTYEAETYDIGVDNETHLYCLANGLVTHNSWCLAFIALTEAIRHPDSIIKLLTDTKLHVQRIFEPIFKEILASCPDELKPEYVQSKFIYYFPNGSQIQMAGTDAGNAESLRGQKARCVLVDEAGFCNNLNYNFWSILFPTTTHTKGKMIMASTPAEEPDHEFVEFIETAEREGSLTKKTLFDNPLLTEKEKNDIVSKFPGGAENPQFRREYLCHIIRDEKKSVFPEFDDDLIKTVVREYEKPAFYTPYVAMDLGFKDLTVCLFGYYDFKNDRVVIEDEICIKGKDLKLNQFADDILAKENLIWLNQISFEQIKPEIRVSDLDLIVIQEINRASRGLLNFIPVAKEPGYKLPLINKIRVMLQTGKIVIDPKCLTLIRHLKNCRWKDASSKDTFARSPDDGHYDAVDALIYLVKSISYTKNPYPRNYNVNADTVYYPQNATKPQGRSNIDIYKSIFNKK